MATFPAVLYVVALIAPIIKCQFSLEEVISYEVDNYDNIKGSKQQQLIQSFREEDQYRPSSCIGECIFAYHFSCNLYLLGRNYKYHALVSLCQIYVCGKAKSQIMAHSFGRTLQQASVDIPDAPLCWQTKTLALLTVTACLMTMLMLYGQAESISLTVTSILCW